MLGRMEALNSSFILTRATVQRSLSSPRYKIFKIKLQVQIDHNSGVLIDEILPWTFRRLAITFFNILGFHLPL